MLRRTPILAVLSCMIMLASSAIPANAAGGGAAGAGGGGRGQGGGRGGGRGGDPAAQMEFTLENIKTQIGATDQEWPVLLPKVQKLLTVQAEVNSGRGNRGRGRGPGGPGGGGGGGGGGGRGGATADNAVARAMQDLQNVLANTGSTAEQIAQRLTILRETKAKAAANLTAAQKDLKELLTSRQEAVLVTMGYLE